MEPIGPLMWEHRTIERAVNLMERELDRIRNSKNLDQEFLRRATDFFRSYADRTHHGKEEDIMFEALSRKSLSSEHQKTMGELKKDHARARELVKQIYGGLVAFGNEAGKGLASVTTALEELVQLYPQHIEKEDKRFFYPAMEYFSGHEKENMLKEFADLDRQLIHEKYKDVLEEMENSL